MLGAVPGVMGVLQAIEAIKHITCIGNTLSGTIIQFDAMNMDFTSVDILRDPECALCGNKPVIHWNKSV